MNGYLSFENDKITDLSTSVPKKSDIIKDFGDLMILPGIIDIHNHGYGGWSMTDPATVEDIKGFAKVLPSIGVTGVLPTAKEDAFEAIARCMEIDYEGARILGIQSEGPFWARGGEHSVDENYPLPDIEETERLLKRAHDKIVIMAIAPELPNAHEVIRYLHQKNVFVALCHTGGFAQDVYDAIDQAGIDLITHTGNGMRGIHHRDVGTLGACLLSEGLYYEIITDLNHICLDMIRIMFRMQPYEKFILISDSNYIAGLPLGNYMRYGRMMVSHESGLIKDLNGRICGSGKYVLFNMKQLVEKLNVSLTDVSKMASLNPARFLKIDQQTGSLEVGKAADLMVIDDAFVCHKTYVKGILAFEIESIKNILNLEALKRRVAD